MQRIRQRRWVRIGVAVLLAIIYAAAWWSEQIVVDQLPDSQSTGTLPPGEYVVERVIDGDTLLLKHHRTRVRLQGVDTPETVKENSAVEPWGPEATAYTKRFVAKANNRVRIEIDGEPIDQYGRHLIFIWHQGQLLNEQLVREGFARAKLAYDYSNRMKDRLRKAQEDARVNRRGIWSR